jgi:hypothetical protein
LPVPGSCGSAARVFISTSSGCTITAGARRSVLVLSLRRMPEEVDDVHLKGSVAICAFLRSGIFVQALQNA